MSVSVAGLPFDDREKEDLEEAEELRGPGEYEVPEEVSEAGIEETEVEEVEEGRTSDPREAVEQGRAYGAPSDPVTRLGQESGERSEMASGFSESVEDAPAEVRDLPQRVRGGDLEVERVVREALANNSETMHLEDIVVTADSGVVTLKGTVATERDLTVVHEIVRQLDGVQSVRMELAVP